MPTRYRLRARLSGERFTDPTTMVNDTVSVSVYATTDTPDSNGSYLAKVADLGDIPAGNYGDLDWDLGPRLARHCAAAGWYAPAPTRDRTIEVDESGPEEIVAAHDVLIPAWHHRVNSGWECLVDPEASRAAIAALNAHAEG